MGESPRHWTVAETLPAQRTATKANTPASGDARACTFIAPSCLAIAGLLIWLVISLAPGQGFVVWVAALAGFWAAAFAYIALRASLVLVRTALAH